MCRLLLVVSLALLWPHAFGQSVGDRPSMHVQASRYVWTTDVDVETRQFRDSIQGSARPGPVYLWLMVRGDQAALDWLRQGNTGTMPVYVFWMRRSLDGLYGDPADVVQLSVGAKEQLGMLANQLAQEGTFSWRVWTGKATAGRGTWTVKIVDPWGGYLMCPTPADPAALCDLEIEVKP